MFNIKRDLLGLALAIGFTASAAKMPQPHVTMNPRPEPRKKGKSGITRRLFARGYNRYAKVPQGERECVRRIGGQAYEEFKARDRVRRGLPAQK
jgi:hypothetical protein